jgi:HemY protein
MIRVVVYLVIVGLLAFAATWLADRPGDVLITWQGQHIETSVMVLIIGVMMVAVLAVMFWTIVRAILRSPDVLSMYLRTRRGVRGYQTVSQGLVAVGSGDVRTARKLADEAARIAPGEPLTLLLTAQASQLAGDRASAERTFQTMAGRDDTRLLGLHGLFIEAGRRGDPAAARAYAEEAAAKAPVPSWAGHAVFDVCCAAGDWVGALERLERNHKSGIVDRTTYQRQRAVLLTARAIAAEEHDRDAARGFALEAVKLVPTLVPSAALAGRMLGEAGDLRRAARLVEAAWKANPHPDLAETFAHLRPGDSARERLARVQSLADKAPGHIEGAIAVVRAALDAQEFAVARKAIEPLLAAPTQRIAMLMAAIEEREQGDRGRAREWMTRAVHARRDPAWTADGFVSERWLPISPVTGRLDAFEWKDPLSGGSDPVALEQAIERELGWQETARRDLDRNRVDRPMIDAPQPPATSSSEADAKPARETVAEVLPELESPRLGRKGIAAASNAAPTVERVIPLIQVPDDPGPDPEPRHEPEPEGTADKPAEGWGKLRGLFK